MQLSPIFAKLLFKGTKCRLRFNLTKCNFLNTITFYKIIDLQICILITLLINLIYHYGHIIGYIITRERHDFLFLPAGSHLANAKFVLLTKTYFRSFRKFLIMWPHFQ